MMQLISMMAAILRPMYCDSTPSGKRMSAPARIGMEIMVPVWIGVRWKPSEMKGAMTPLSTQMAKEKSK